jgi:acyl-homoserine-lactone acylase
MPVFTSIMQTLGLLTLTIFLGLKSLQAQQPSFDPSRITIARDEYGVPHIFAPTDAEVAYGMAWAHCEDYFEGIQEMLVTLSGRMGELKGKKGAISDFFGHYIRMRHTVDTSIKDFSPEFLQVVDGYVAGVNAYAAAHPKNHLLKNLFPAPREVVLSGYFMVTVGSCGLIDALKSIVRGTPDDFRFPPLTGSNAWAFSRRVVAENETHVMLNPHLPLEGTHSFWEAHLHSDEGWNVLGIIFPGMVSPGMGVTPTYAWALTSNWPDFVDIYSLRMHPEYKKKKHKYHYKFDGQWQPLEVTKAKLKVKLKPWLPKITVKRNVYWSVYGPVMETKQGFFATRYPMHGLVQASEQWYRFSKAKSLQDFQTAIDMQAIPNFNFVYGDKDDNILLFHNAKLGVRNPAYNWQRVLPGDTSATLWTEYVPTSYLPQSLNPDCGYVYNTNNYPLANSGAECNPDPNQFSVCHAFDWNRENNRDLRFRELMDELLYDDGKITLAEIEQVKYDHQFPQAGSMVKRTMAVYNTLDPNDFPNHADLLRHIQAWDFRGDSLNPYAALALMTMYLNFTSIDAGFTAIEDGYNFGRDTALRHLQQAADILTRAHGSYKIPLAKMMRHERGSVSLALNGLPEGLRAIYLKQSPVNPGILRTELGDQYTAFAQYGPEGLRSVHTSSPFGSSMRPDSPHYTDQMEMYVRQQTKPMTLDKSKVLQNAKRTYHPTK